MQDETRLKPGVVLPSRGSHRRGSLVASIVPSDKNVGTSSELDAHASLQEKKKDVSKFSFSYLNEFRAFVPSLFVDHVQSLIERDAVADISGFTELSNKLSIERLKVCINDFFKIIIEVINEFRGDIIKFCGDSLMISWSVSCKDEGDERERTAAAILAVECALCLVQTCSLDVSLSSQDVFNEDINLRLHCGVGSGRTRGFCVGENERWEYFVTGDALQGANISLTQALLGEVVISESVKCELGRNVPIDNKIIDLQPRRTQTNQMVYLLSNTNATEPSIFSLQINSSSDSNTATFGSFVLSRVSSSYPSRVILSAARHVVNLFVTFPVNASESDHTGDRNASVSAPGCLVNNFYFTTPDGLATLSIDRVIYLEKILRTMVHECALNAIESCTSEFMAELRTITCLFIEITDIQGFFSCGDIDGIQEVSRVVVHASAIKGGSLRQIVFDDKGFVIIVVFGLSGSSYNDDCKRAVELSFLVRSAVRGLGRQLDTKIGVTIGENVFCGTVGNISRCEYVLMGSSINLSARLMKQCSVGMILVDELVYRHCSSEFHFEEECKIIAKGYKEPISVYEPVGKETVKAKARADTLRSSFRGRDSKLHGNPFFCRHKELTYVLELLDFRTQKTAAACILQGPPSVGKSKIVLEALVSEGSHAAGVAFGVALHLLKQIFVRDEGNMLTSASANQLHGTSNHTGILSSRFQRTISGLKAKRLSKEDRDELTVESIQTGYSGLLNTDDDLNTSCDITTWFEKRSNLDESLDDFLGLLFKEDDDDINPESDDDSSASADQNFVEQDKLFGLDEKLALHMFKVRDLACFVREIVSGQSIAKSGSYGGKDALTLAIYKFSGEIRTRIVVSILSNILLLALQTGNRTIIVDNLNLVDDSSLRTFIVVVENMKRGVFIGITRADPEKKRSKIIRGREDLFFDRTFGTPHNVNIKSSKVLMSLTRLCQVQSIHPFDVDDIAHIVNLVVKTDNLPNTLSINQLVNEILTRTRGMPFMVLSMLRTVNNLIDKKRFYGIDDLPCGSNNILLSNFDRLEINDKVVLKVASVIGTNFTLPLLQYLLVGLKMSSNIFNIEERISLVSDSTGLLLIDFHADSATTIYAFADPAVRLSVYNLMLEAQRQRVHFMVGNYFQRELCTFSSSEALTGNTDSMQFFSCLLRTATHFCNSDDSMKKIEYHILLAEYYRMNRDDIELCQNFESLLVFVVGRSSLQIIDFCRSPPSSFHPDIDEAGGDYKTRSSRTAKRRRSSLTSSAVEFSSLRIRPVAKSVNMNLDAMKSLDANTFTQKFKLKFLGFQGLTVDKVALWLGDVGLIQFRLFKFPAAYNCLIAATWNFDVDRTLSHTTSNVHHFVKRLESISDRIAKNVRSPDLLQENAPIHDEVDVSKRLDIYAAAITTAIILGNILIAKKMSIEALSIIEKSLPLSYKSIVENVLPLVAVVSLGLGFEKKSETVRVFSFETFLSILSPSWSKVLACSVSLRTMAVAEILADPLQCPRGYSIFQAFSAEGILRSSGDTQLPLIKLQGAVSTLNFIGEEIEEQLVKIYFSWVLFVSGRHDEARANLETIKTFGFDRGASQILSWALELQILIDTFALKFKLIRLSLASYAHTNKARPTESIYGSAVCAFTYFTQNEMILASPKAAYVCRKLAMASSCNISTFVGGIMIFCGLHAAFGILQVASSSDVRLKGTSATDEALTREAVSQIKKYIVLALKNYECSCETAFPGLTSLTLALNMKLVGLDIQNNSSAAMNAALRRTDEFLRGVSSAHLRCFAFGCAFLHSERSELCVKLDLPTTFYYASSSTSHPIFIPRHLYDSIVESKLSFHAIGLNEFPSSRAGLAV